MRDAVGPHDFEEDLLAAAVALAPPDRALPDSGTATLAFCGALAPLADGLRGHTSRAELREDVAWLGGAAATLLRVAPPTPVRLHAANPVAGQSRSRHGSILSQSFTLSRHKPRSANHRGNGAANHGSAILDLAARAWARRACSPRLLRRESRM